MKARDPFKAGVVLALMSICASGIAADDISPALADSSKERHDRDLTLIRDNSSSAADHKVLMTLREELRTRLVVINDRLRDTSESESSLRMLRAERENVIRNGKMIGELIARFQ